MGKRSWGASVGGYHDFLCRPRGGMSDGSSMLLECEGQLGNTAPMLPAYEVLGDKGVLQDLTGLQFVAKTVS